MVTKPRATLVKATRSVTRQRVAVMAAVLGPDDGRERRREAQGDLWHIAGVTEGEKTMFRRDFLETQNRRR